jgi:uncharacterized protein YjbI with pentapeptide repeats
MDAKELIKRYNEGERNFEGITLLGPDFDGIDLWSAYLTNDILDELPDYVEFDAYGTLCFLDLNHPLSEEHENPWQFDLSGSNLQEINLSNAYLYRVNLEGANISKANLKYAKIINANLKDINLSKADCRKAKFYDTNLENANLYMTRFEKAAIASCNFNKANFERTKLKKVYLFSSGITLF